MSQQIYRAFCAAAPADLPLFMQPWYLDASCLGGRWDAAVETKGQEVVAVWPYFLKKKGPWQYVAMPQLTRQMGPYIVPEYRTTRHETRLLEKLSAGLPSGLAAFEQDFNYTVTNWLPLYWQGYRQTTRYSYLLNIKDLKTVRENLAADYRNQKIPKAAKKVQVKTGGSLHDFQQVHDRSYTRQGLPTPISPEFLQGLDAALATQGQRELFFARDRSNGQIHSVAYLVWDAQSAYYLLAGDDPEFRASGAGILLAWEAIRYAHEVLRLPTFDFAGSMVRPIERVRRQFGAIQQPYFRLQREWSLWWKLGKTWRSS
ncbi:MAG: GNAT family N-acetyltransferase [Saprospiraceae bacterium]